MLKRTTKLISKAGALQQLPLRYLKPSSALFSYVQKAAFSSIWQKTYQQPKNLNLLMKHSFASLPAHSKMAMPALSPTMEQGNIIKWNFKEGDKVGVGDQICEIETDKATLGFELQDEGYVAKILISEGTKGVKVGTPIVILVDSQASVKAFQDYKGDAPTQQAESQPKTADKPKEEPKQAQKQTITTQTDDHYHSENIKGTHRRNVMIHFTHGHHEPHGQTIDIGHKQSTGGKVLASPLARKIAAEKGIDLSQVSGSGPNGRVLKHDVEGYTPKPVAKPTVTEQAAPKATAATTPKSQPTAVTNAPNPYVEIPLTDARKAHAQQSVESKNSIPHYYVGIDIYVNEALGLVETLNKGAKSQVTFSDLIIKAAAKSCIDIPETNSHWNGKEIRKYKNVDVGYPVYVGSELVNTVVSAANIKGIGEIAKATTLLADKAKGNVLQPNETEGATFTILNLGASKLTQFTAVIPPPQSAALSVGAVVNKVIPEGEGFKEVKVLNVMLTGDHRVVDGALAARWLQAFKGYLEKPHTMLL